ncbi:hypothetical protein [Paenibacillus sp. SI8]|uniref:hypothetical protein n=1 Tax=unclassified Paenibacillus TaxID=185978 RepID=UPI003465FDFF
MMKPTARDSIELHMLTSLARSQRALCRIMEAIADQVETSGELVKHVSENLEAISKYQRALVYKITKLSPRKRRKGKPADPWINATIASRKIGQFPRK